MNDLVVIPATYDYRLVALSVAIAILASYAALEMAGRINATRGSIRTAWLAGGAIAMGCGIWAMHYVGMLAYRLPIHVYYNVPTVALSLFAAMAASWVALFVVSRPRMTAYHVVIGSLLMGAGIAAMHYTGMAAMRLHAMHHYQPGLVMLSILLAVMIAFVAIGLIFYFREGDRSQNLEHLSSIVMGLAIPVMHYTGMAAVRFTPAVQPLDLTNAVDISTLANSGIVIFTLLVIGFALLISVVDRRLASQANLLVLSEQRYQKLFESNPHPTIVFDPLTMFPWKVNQAAIDVFGYSADEWTGLRVTVLNERQDFVAQLLENSEDQVTETQYRRKDGAAVDVEVRLRTITWGIHSAALLMAADITERKNAEREREKMEVQLRHAQKLESIGQLAAGLAHEINTPTQYIGDNVHFLGDAFDELHNLFVEYDLLLAAAKHGEVPKEMIEAVANAVQEAHASYLMEEIPKAIQQTREGVGRVTSLIQAMKEFSYPGGKEKVPVDLNRAIESTITVARNEWKYVADMKTDYDSSLPMVNCLPSEFNQVILNLVINAAHSIEDVVGRNGTRKGTITVQTRNCPEWAEVRITDSGNGIPENIRSRIFDPFFTTKEVGKGTGQGLAIARNVIVDKHGGTIHFETQERKGTTFVVRLPYNAGTKARLPVPV
jgi:PAS domain S-box-containing protein